MKPRNPAGYNGINLKSDAGKLTERRGRRYDIPEEEHQEEVSRHPLAWILMTAMHAQEDRT